ncbi:hypothetical protein [Staphylococcus rostri]|uniref:Uncharacterized protein n=1 Tax=Staphylococcus rostri TaxID=522262 RepID=A0A2K3YV02_9STAP|nr:hypothetical protein [Staphylococcus rostri]PNZ29436.1 hypothetical protein CD122_01995 [Staphylococcus rostri]
MKTIKFEDQMRHIRKNKEAALKATRAIFEDFNPGERKFDRPRKNPEKAKALAEFEKRFIAKQDEINKQS